MEAMSCSLEGIQISMVGSQKASGGEGSNIYQSQRDTNVGFTSEQLREIIETIGDQLPKYAQVASAIVEERLKGFEEKIVERFERDDKANSQTFKDPDFQYLLSMAQHTYARTDDPDVCGILIDLIAERSSANDRNRLSLSLNEAVGKAGLLTNSEFSELSLCFITRYTQVRGLNSFNAIIRRLRALTENFLDDIEYNETSYLYIQAQSCGNIDVTSLFLRDILINAYGGIFTKGLSKEEISEILKTEEISRFSGLIIPSPHEEGNFQVNAVSKDIFDNSLVGALIPKSRKYALWQSMIGNSLSKDEIIEKLAMKDGFSNRTLRRFLQKKTTPTRDFVSSVKKHQMPNN